MDQSFNEDIDELVKSSKQLQNKMRQELRRQATPSSCGGELEDLPPIWNKVMLNPYVKTVVADYLVANSNFTINSLQSGVQSGREKSIKGDKFQGKDTARSSQTQVKKTLELRAEESVVHLRKNPATIDTQSSKDELKNREASLNNTKRKTKITGISPNRNRAQSSASRRGGLEVPKNRRESDTSRVKPLVYKYQHPLQRFTGNFKKNIDFSKEHPNLELDTSSKQTTLFPRRFHKESKACVPLHPSIKNDSTNIKEAAGKIEPPDAAPVLQQETWKEVLLKNRIKEKPQKILRLKKGIEVMDSCKKTPDPDHEIKETKGIDIILKPANGLFHLEKQVDTLSKQKQCNLQRFPVMYIRPECQMQRVAKISIDGDCEGNRIHSEAIHFSSNVKYIECIHGEEMQGVGSSSPKVEIGVVNDKPTEVIPRKENRFFKAMERIELLKNSSINRDSSSSSSNSSPKNSPRTSPPKTYTHLPSQVQLSSSLPSVETSDNDMHDIMERILPKSERMHIKNRKDLIKNRPTRREVYVQTDFKETVATSPMKLPTPQPQEFASSIAFSAHRHASCSHCLTKNHEEDNFKEDDFINKIFERIRNDVPNALQAFKDRSTNTHEEFPLEFHSIKQQQEQKQSLNHQKSAINNASKTDVPLNEIKAGLTKRRDSSHVILEMPPPVDSPVTMQSPPVGGDDRKFLLLHQNPLFVKTINRIKSSAVPDDGRIKEKRHNFPTDTEIKRAVKIFLDSLTLDEAGERKSITKCDSGRKKLTLPRSELISSRRFTKYTNSSSNTSSSTSSNSSKNENINKSDIFRCNVFRSSTSTTLSSSDSELESELTVDAHPLLPTKIIASSHSDGEVLSLGEI